MPLPTFLLVIASVLLSALAQITLRKAMLVTPLRSAGATEWSVLLKQLAFNPYLSGGLVLFVASLVLWLSVLSTTPVSLAYPLSSIGFVLTALLAWLLLDEPIGTTRAAGIALICLGVLIVGRSA